MRWHDEDVATHPNNGKDHTYLNLPMSHPLIQRYIHWLLTPVPEREPPNQQRLAEELGVTYKTMKEWKNRREFLAEWERQYLKHIGSPERKSHIMDTLYKTATDGDDPKHVQAAKEYFAIEGSLKPQRMDVTVSRDASELSDDQINAMLAAHAQSEAERRAGETVE